MPDPTPVLADLAHASPALLLCGAVCTGLRRPTARGAWRVAEIATATAALLAGFALVSNLVTGRAPTPAGAVLVLVTFVGWVLARYAGTYLAGEPRQYVFVRWLLATLAGASLVVTTDHLGVLVFAWFATSLSLQRLLIFYADRPQAQMAAHKKFLVSRTADLCMVAAALLLAGAYDTLHLGELAHAAATSQPNALAVWGAVLIVVATLLKSAQLPFHGWLMQVMEAPTPVSALLHAGVVNLGGFVLIQLAPLVAAVPAAQVLLVVSGSLTATLAALVMTTRVSVKVGLAWSTCAQMGFMLVQCGLGLSEMALLHLLAHSLYKAHAFLGAGSTVERTTVRGLAPQSAAAGLGARLWSAAGGLVVVALAGWLLGVDLVAQPGLAAMAIVTSLALTPMLAAWDAARPLLSQARATLTSFALAAAWLGLHELMAGWIGRPLAGPPAALVIWMLLCFVALFAVQTLVAMRPRGHLAARLHGWFYGGLFLDEWFTRLTLRVWPIRVPATTGDSPSLSAEATR